MRDILERREAKECIEGLKLSFMRKAVAPGLSDDERREAAQSYQLIDRLVAELANYNPKDEQNE